jgi:hypothetical protein
MPIRYSVSVTDWTSARGYANSGRGWRVRCFGMRDDDWNAPAITVYESFFPTESEARDVATAQAQIWAASLLV